ncbi:uncharacterized protein [Penaeus vannamei]|uniref:uncharacterized protein n=1 Tax=Penaeus vannamei TaxID=6689 RepID=UPI00387FA5EB
MSISARGSGAHTGSENSFLFRDFLRSQKLRISGSWYQPPDPHCWMWYINADNTTKEIDHILVNTRWRILQNCRVYRSAKFCGTDHKLVVATLRVTAVRLLSRQIVSNPVAVWKCWAEYFEQLYQVDPLTVNLDAGSAVIPLPDPPISEDPSSSTEVRGAISKMKSGKEAGVCGTPAELLKADVEPIAQGLHAVLAAIWRSKCEFGCELLAAYIDLKKVFDMVHQESLWEILRLRGIPARIIGCSGGLSSFFPVSSGVRQGCVLAPTFFNICMDWIPGRATVQSHCGATLGSIKVTDLDLANDVAILSVSGNPSGGSGCIE